MTVNTTSNKISLPANGSVNQFSFPFPGVNTNDIQLWITNAAGVISQIALFQYQVTLNAPVGANPTSVGGVVTYPLTGPPLASGNTVTIIRELPQVQNDSFANQSTLYPVVIETALDYLTMVDQQAIEVENRAITVALSDPPPPSLPPAAQRANQAFVFDSAGNPTVGTIPTGAVVSPAMAPVVSATTLLSARAQMGVPGYLTAKSFGATGDGHTDDTAALQNWIRACQTQGLPGWIEAGNYLLSSAIIADQAGPLIIRGPGNGTSFTPGGFGSANILLGNTTQDGIRITNCNGIIQLENFTMQPVTPSAFTQTAGAGLNFQNALSNARAQGPVLRNLVLSNMFFGIVSADSPTPGPGSGSLVNYMIDCCTIVASNTCIVLPSGGDGCISRCTISPTGSTAQGVAMVGDPGGLRFLSNKVITQNGLNGLIIQPSVSDGDILLSNSSFEMSGGSTTCVYLAALSSGLNWSNTVIVGCEFVNTGTNVCIDLGPGTALALERISITGNVFYNGGIRLAGATRFVVNSNAFNHTNTIGDITIGSTCTKGIVLGNSIAQAINNAAGANVTVVNNVGP